MKRTPRIILLACCAAITACDREDSPPTRQDSTGSEQSNQTATSAIENATTEARDAALAGMRETLAEWDAKLASLRTKSEALGADAGSKAEEALTVMQREFEQAGKYLNEVTADGKSHWQSLKTEFDEAVKRLASAYEAAAKELRSES